MDLIYTIHMYNLNEKVISRHKNKSKHSSHYINEMILAQKFQVNQHASQLSNSNHIEHHWNYVDCHMKSNKKKIQRSDIIQRLMFLKGQLCLRFKRVVEVLQQEVIVIMSTCQVVTVSSTVICITRFSVSLSFKYLMNNGFTSYINICIPLLYASIEIHFLY